MKRLICISLIVAMLTSTLSLSACGLYDKEYVAVNNYEIDSQNNIEDEGKNLVHNFSEMKRAIEDLVYNGSENGIIIFSESYQGDHDKDIADACWQVRSQNALCAYCVYSIDYEISKIVSYYEAKFTIKYADTEVALKDIHHVGYSSQLVELANEALHKNLTKLVVLADSSVYSSDDVIDLVERSYYNDPICAPNEPAVSVKIYSSNNFQKLYDISFNYSLSEDMLDQRKKEMNSIKYFTKEYETDLDKIHAVADYFTNNTVLSEENSIYSVLVQGNGNSKALALAFSALCKKVGLESYVVVGEKKYVEQYWIIVKIDENFYHFDPYTFLMDGYNFKLYNDTEMWDEYRWDTSSYPACNNTFLIDE